MRTLLINKFYYMSGGAERYVFEWEEILRRRGHDVMIFSMRHPLNLPCAQERFFAPQVTFETDAPACRKMRAALASVWSREAGRKLDDLLDAEGAPDVAHLHSFAYQLTPSILAPLVKRGIPIIQTCHEYAHICVNQRLYNQRTLRICEACLEHGRLAPLWTRCLKGSFSAGAAACLAGLVDTFAARSRERVRRFLTPSAFMRRKLIQGGMPPRRVSHLPNFIDASTVKPSSHAGDFILFLGRLVPQKGVFTFLKAAERVPHVPCKLGGGGPLEQEARTWIDERGLSHIELLGHREGEALWELVARARAVVVPSEWYEPFSLVILEGMAAARPIIASDIAGPAEIISHGRDGLLVPPGRADELAAAFETLWNDPDAAREMGRCGRRKVETQYCGELHYQRLLAHYTEIAD